MITADEAQAILDALNAPRARHSLNCHTHRDCDGCRDDDQRDSLCLHTEPLARAFVAQATEFARLRTAAREYLAARAAPLTDAELAAMRAYVVDVATCGARRCVGRIAAVAATSTDWFDVARDLDDDLKCRACRPLDGVWTPRVRLAAWIARAIAEQDAVTARETFAQTAGAS